MKSVKAIITILVLCLIVISCKNDKGLDPAPTVIDFRTKYAGSYTIDYKCVTTVFGQPGSISQTTEAASISLSDSSSSQLIYRTALDSFACDSVSSKIFQMWDYVNFHPINGTIKFFDEDSIKLSYGGAISPAASFNCNCKGKQNP